MAAAETTAQNNVNCVGGTNGADIRPFYWEVGDQSGTMDSGSVTASGGLAITATTKMSIASASKWFYSSYWIQRIGGYQNLTATDIQYFNFWSGYTNFSSCSGDTSPDPTVASCLTLGTNGVQDPTTIGKFDYGGGHMQEHAANIASPSLGALDNAGLAAEIQKQVGTDINIAYTEPQLAGGGFTSASEYAKLLRKILSGTLLMHDALDVHQVCASPNVCPSQAVSSPAPKNENWNYSIGHWVEDTSNDSDGAFSSPGAFGFYPWIDKTKTYYGVVARQVLGGALTSVYCGREIRKAWVTGVAQ